MHTLGNLLYNVNIFSAIEEAIGSNDVWIGGKRGSTVTFNSDFKLLNGEFLFAARATGFEELLYYWPDKTVPRDTQIDEAVIINSSGKFLQNLQESEEFFGACEIGY